MKYVTIINDKEFEIEIGNDGRLTVNGEPRDVDFLPLGPALYSVLRQHSSHEVVIDVHDDSYEVLMSGRLYTGRVLDERAQLLAARSGGGLIDSGEISIKAPMPGLVIAVLVDEGQAVTKGQTIIILESMKMQNELKAPRDGVVQRISVEAHQSVEQNKLLITLT
ncbi:MAG: biotin/lipoyl-binding protein [Chloroflexi bacterium]|nr:biotin/lipoyl-binding protein [Chloroflexota bacterium]